MPDFDDYVQEIASLWESGWLTNRGTKVQQLEGSLRSYLGVENAALMSNGHAALETILQACELEGEVITTPFTFASTANAIVRSGLQPRFADVRQYDFTLDPERVRELITPRTSAILPVHIYGGVCDVEALQKIADDHGLALIYDAAHAFGVQKDGVGIGAFGDASMFSLHATKAFNSIEGGLAVTGSAEVAERIIQLQNFGFVSSEEIEHIGGNAKMHEFSAAMGICNLRDFDIHVERRRAVDEEYRRLLRGVPGISLLEFPESITRNYAYFPITVEPDVFGMSRDALEERLRNDGILCRKYFSPLVTQFAAYRDRHDGQTTPIAASAAAQVLTLPMYADLEIADVTFIAESIWRARNVA